MLTYALRCGCTIAANPWNYIRHLTDPDDYVVVKLKAGTIAAEAEFVKQLLEWQGGDIRSNIDEIFFEHRVNLQVGHTYSGCL
jgi:hypothetical protein